MRTLEDLWQRFLSGGGRPDATEFGIWLIREQPVIDRSPASLLQHAGEGVAAPDSGDTEGGSVKSSLVSKISLNSDGSPTGFDSMDYSVRAAIMVGRLDRFLHYLVKPCMRDSGMTEDEFVVLATLLYTPRISKTQLLRQCLIEIPTGSELLKRMKKGGLILEKRNPEDGRSAFINISAHGRQQLLKAFRSLGEVEDALTALTENEKILLLQILDKLDLHHSRRHEIRQVKELMAG